MKGNFKVILTIIFIAFAVIGVLVFSGAIPIGEGDQEGKPQGRVVIWGTVRAELLNNALNDFNGSNDGFVVNYVQKYPETFNEDLLEALASGTGPDLFFLPNDLAYSYSNKIFTIPYTSFPLASFKTAFVGAGEVFTTSRGILAFPITVDPIMMFYNRSMLDSKNIINPPQFWDELLAMAPQLSDKDESRILQKSAVALGQFVNINNAKEIINTLFMQSGSSIIQEDEGFYSSALDNPGLGNMLSFYTNFSNPISDSYSWNRSLPNSQEHFASDDVAIYFGFASELPTLLAKNPNQNLHVAQVPQIRNINSKSTSARVIGIAISSASKNLNTAFITASMLANGDFAFQFANALNTAPARRDLLASVKPTDSFFPHFYSSALFAKSWLDPDPDGSNDAYRIMIDNVLSNGTDPDAAVRDMAAKLELLLLR